MAANSCDAPRQVTVDIRWADALQEQFGSAPWWTISALVHILVLALLSLVVVSVPAPPMSQLILVDGFAPPPEEPEPQTPPVRYPGVIDTEERVTQERTCLPVEIEEIDEPETLNLEESADPGARGDPDEIADLPMHERGAISFLGLGGGRGGSLGEPWARGRRRAKSVGVGPGHATDDSERAVDAALAWLARHQEPDGHWEADRFGGTNTDAGVTGLALLAFLGAGHCERTRSPYQLTVIRAVNWLVAHQDADGCIGRGYEGGLGYHHAIGGLALAEAFGMSSLERTGLAAQKAVDYSIQKHQCEYSGWRYDPRQEPDMSVTGWFVMQLKSAQVANLSVDGRGFLGAVQFLDKCTKTDGNYPGLVSYQPDRSATPTMTAVGALSRLFMGWKRSDPLLSGAAHYLAGELPRWEGGGEGVNFYYWYYATLVMYMMGGEHWRAWSPAMRDMLVERQRRGAPDVDGSWDPVGAWCDRGGRVFSTAIGALCLEVYYRYLPGGWDMEPR